MKKILETIGIGVGTLIGCFAYFCFYAVMFALMIFLVFKILSWM